MSSIDCKYNNNNNNKTFIKRRISIECSIALYIT